MGYHLINHLKYDGFPLALLKVWFQTLGYEACVVDAGNWSLDAFLLDIRKALKVGAYDGAHDDVYLLVNYSRTAIGQRMFSGGHYATIGGYNEAEDKTLLLEVNAWRYPSVWVDTRTLWEALRTQTASGSWRGYLRVVATPPKAGGS